MVAVKAAATTGCWPCTIGTLGFRCQPGSVGTSLRCLPFEFSSSPKAQPGGCGVEGGTVGLLNHCSHMFFVIEPGESQWVKSTRQFVALCAASPSFLSRGPCKLYPMEDVGMVNDTLARMMGRQTRRTAPQRLSLALFPLLWAFDLLLHSTSFHVGCAGGCFNML